jgi:ubiquinone/menaquinone biosynthesis C-methylase UbiE
MGAKPKCGATLLGLESVMIENILSYMRCPRCTGTNLHASSAGVTCRPCNVQFPFREGILDLMEDGSAEVITPFQRIMQTQLVVSVYEGLWRRLGYFIASSRSFEKEVQTILNLRQGLGTERVLDLACGTGIFTRPLARRTQGIVIGLDLSWPMLREARRLAERDGVRNVVLMRGTAYRLPFIAGAFPYINCCGALHLFDRPELALKEIERVLHSAGHLTVQTTIRPEHSGGIAYVLERFIRFGFFSETALREQVRLHGLKMLASERHRISYTFLARHIS